ncbi:anion permease [Fusibacter paucivorans]|uniref:Sodium-dependent dicarboxylate transporter SdcS n=1 Tax=Fusibacter paucivorans TaxID=76009 RepID=A0ABS5PT22_9FIRM|nr:SLC13 family permease [Fusibacter paucivorans]MBS7527524.1 anion permease [Fusibacter paucivorans]
MEKLDKQMQKKFLNTLIGLCLMFLFKYLPTPENLPQVGMQLIGITVGALYLWTTVSIGWPSFACIFAIATTGVMNYSTAISSSIGHWIILFLICCYLVSHALIKTGVAHRIAVWFVTRPIARKSPWLFVMMLDLSVLVLTMFLSGITTLAISLPIAESILTELGYDKNKKELFPQLLILSVAFCACIGQGMTPVGHSTVLLGFSILKSLTGLDISFAAYMAFGIPVGILTFGAMILFFKFIVKPDMTRFDILKTNKMNFDMHAITIQEKIAIGTYGVVFVAWVLPSFIKNSMPGVAGFLTGMGTVGPILLAVIVLSIIHIDHKPILNIKEGFKESVGWEGLFLVGAVLALSKALAMEEVGIVPFFTQLGQPVLANLSTFVFIIIVITTAAVLTNLISNNITIAVLTNIAIALSATLGVSPVLLTVLIASISNYAFATPAATLQMTIAMGSGWIEPGKMFKMGVVTMFIAIIIMIVVGMPILQLFY